jgi:hypothetical protein
MVVLGVRDNKTALGLAVASLVVYAATSIFVTGPEQALWWLASYVAAWGLYLALFLRERRREFVAAPWVLLAWAAAARLVLVSSDVWLSDDLWRYLLDGRVLAEGTNPFRYAPADPFILERFAQLAGRVNHPEVPTIYPPTIQALGWLSALAGFQETGWRLVVTVIDVGAMCLVARLFGGGDAGWRAAAVYGLCPLLVFETGANGHLEAVAALPLVFAVHSMGRRRPWRAGIAFGIAILAKYYALLLLPLWLRREGFRRMSVSAVAVSALGILPFTLGGVDVFAGLKTYLGHWSFNSPVFTLLHELPVDPVLLRSVPFILAGLASVIAGWRREDPVGVIPMLLFGFLVIGPTLHPWYALWVLPWLGGRPHPGLWAFVGAMGGAYAVWWSVARYGEWALPSGVAEVIWSIVAIGWLFSFWRDPGETPEPV